jgi:hypothetical protein
MRWRRKRSARIGRSVRVRRSANYNRKLLIIMDLEEAGRSDAEMRPRIPARLQYYCLFATSAALAFALAAL